MASPTEAQEVLEEIFAGKAQDHSKVSTIATQECSDIDNDKALEKQMHDLKFDLAVIDTFPPSRCLQFISLKLGIPFVLIPADLNMESTRSPIFPSFFPLSITLYSDNMSFTQRLINSVLVMMVSTPPLCPFPGVKNTSLIEKYSKDPSISSWSSLSRRAELHLVARGEILEYPVPVMPNVINIECLTCKPTKPLPGDLQKMADQSEGVVVVSFGSLIAEFPEETAKKFLQAFGNRKELFFWRYKKELPAAVPRNVKIMKWLPQNDLLGHPKTRLFITHAGNNGQYESVYHGVPMLAFPLFAEQHHNAHRIMVHGYGIQSDIVTFSVDELLAKIDKVINEPSYRKNTHRASEILKNRVMNAQENSVYWIEHVLEFGSDHLKSYALQMPWYSFYMFDVLLFLEVLCFVIIFMIFVLCRFAYRKLHGKTPQKKQKRH